MTCASARFPIKIDERAEPMKVAPDNGDHKRKSQSPGACERLWRAANAEPDRDLSLMRPWKNALTVKGRPEATLPSNMDLVTQLQEKVEFLREQRVIVLHSEAEQRIGFPERAAPNHDFCSTFGDEIHGGEFLEKADGIDGAEDSDGAGEANALCASSGGREDHRRRRIEEFLAVMLADAKHIESDPVGSFYFR
jgi:hypothetical protein